MQHIFDGTGHLGELDLVGRGVYHVQQKVGASGFLEGRPKASTS